MGYSTGDVRNGYLFYLDGPWRELTRQDVVYNCEKIVYNTVTNHLENPMHSQMTGLSRYFWVGEFS